MTRCGYCGARFEVRDGSTVTITLEGPSRTIENGYHGRRFCCEDHAKANARHEARDRAARRRALLGGARRKAAA